MLVPNNLSVKANLNQWCHASPSTGITWYRIKMPLELFPSNKKPDEIIHTKDNTNWQKQKSNTLNRLKHNFIKYIKSNIFKRRKIQVHTVDLNCDSTRNFWTLSLCQYSSKMSSVHAKTALKPKHSSLTHLITDIINVTAKNCINTLARVTMQERYNDLGIIAIG